MYTAVYYGGGLYRIFYDGQPIGMLDVRSIDWAKVAIVKESDEDNQKCVKNTLHRGGNALPERVPVTSPGS